MKLYHTIPCLLVIACGDNNSKQTDTASVTDTEDSAIVDTEDTRPPFYATGEGTAYFLDGLQANSLVTINMNPISIPPEDELYVVYLLNDQGLELYAGPMPVSNTTISWQSELNTNALLQGYNRLQIRFMSDNRIIYSGSIDPVVYNTYSQLIVSSPDTASGEGSLREIQHTLQAIYAHQDYLINLSGDLTAIYNGAEAMVNSVFGSNVDYNGDGTVESINGVSALIGENLANTQDTSNLRNLVLRDLASASAAAHQIAPTHHIKDLANYAYDCTQLVGTYVQEAADITDNIAAKLVTDEVGMDARLTESNQYISYAIHGFDTNEDGAIDDFTEGTINCAIYYVSQMAYMDIEVE